MTSTGDQWTVRMLREELVAISRRSYERGLVPGVSGNNSVRVPGTDTMLIKTSGSCMGDMTPEDTVHLTLGGDVLDGERRPSKEWQFHAAIYRVRPDVGAVAHLHPPYSVAFTVAGQIPPLVTAATRGHVREVGMVPLLPAGSIELAEAVEAAMNGSELRAVLMQEHGTITVGPDLRTAYYRTEYLEDNARVALLAGMAAGQLAGDLVLAHDPDPTAEGG